MMTEELKIELATVEDIPQLYQLQLLAFESEAEMIGSRDVPALMESEEENRSDFENWTTLKLVNEDGVILGAIRYQPMNGREGCIEVGRLMTHPDCRRMGLAKRLIGEVDRVCPEKTKELYTCTKSWVNIRLYESMGYEPYKEVTESTGLSFVYMWKGPCTK